jgi:hypothetical protein
LQLLLWCAFPQAGSSGNSTKKRPAAGQVSQEVTKRPRTKGAAAGAAEEVKEEEGMGSVVPQVRVWGKWVSWGMFRGTIGFGAVWVPVIGLRMDQETFHADPGICTSHEL